MAQDGLRARRVIGASVAAIGLVTAALVAPNASATLPGLLTVAATSVTGPVGIDYYEPADQMLTSVNYDTAGVPFNFELIDAAGTQTQFGTVAGLGDEVYISSVRSGSCQGGFAVGDAFTGNGNAGEIMKIDGTDPTIVTNPWVTLPGETGLLRGGLFQDRYCALPAPYAGDLVVTTNAGDVWVVDSAGVATELVTNLGVSDFDAGGVYVVSGGIADLEGPTTVPNASTYGPWAGKILATDEVNGVVWAIDATAQTATAYIDPACPVGGFAFFGNCYDSDSNYVKTSDYGSAEGMHVIPNGQNFYAVDYAAGQILGAAAADFAAYQGDILLVDENGQLVNIHWDAGDAHFAPTVINTGQASSFEGSTFAPAGLPGLPPATTIVYDGATTGEYSDLVNLSATLTDTSSGDPIEGATVDFIVDGVSVGTGTTDTAGKATKAYTVADSGPHSVTASYTGDADHASSSDPDNSLAVTPDECTISYTGDVLVNPLQTTNLRGQLADPSDTAGDMSAHTMTFAITNSAAVPVLPSPTAGPSNTAGLATTTKSLPSDTYEVGASSNGNARQAACSTSATTMVTVSAANAKATGGGWSTVTSGKFSFGFNLIPQAGGTYTGEIQVRTHNGKNLFHGRNVSGVTGSGSTAKWNGTGFWNGASGATFTITVVDNGLGGKKLDTINLVVKNAANATVFTTSGAVSLKGGNITVKTK